MESGWSGTARTRGAKKEIGFSAMIGLTCQPAERGGTKKGTASPRTKHFTLIVPPIKR
jgi:hypothetical protein